MSSFTSWRWRVVAAAAAMVTLGAACGGPTGPSVPVPEGAGSLTSDRQLFGVFLGSDEKGVERMAEFERFLGGRQMRVGHTYLEGGSWDTIAEPGRLLQPWSRWKAEHPDDLFVLNVPMAAPNEPPEQEARRGGQALTDDQVASLLEAGAGGEFDGVYRNLAQELVKVDLADAVLVPGWEMNGTTYSHRCAPNPEAWKQFFRRVVAAMRSVDGQKFLFDFNPSRGAEAVPWPECYPGDDVVDIIGMDSYDQPTGKSFQQQIDEDYGLQDHVDFAKQRGKPISFPEWGLFRNPSEENPDNPEYIRRMSEWIAANDTVYSTYTNYCPHTVLVIDDPGGRVCANPRSSEVFQEMFSD